MHARWSCDRRRDVRSRRDFLAHFGHGLGTVALAHLLLGDNFAPGSDGRPDSTNPLAERSGHFPARAQRVISLFMTGGPSHVDTFDPKPELSCLDGQPLPASFRSDDLRLQFMKAAEGRLMGSPFPFARHGQSGLEMSSLFPHLSRHADDLAVVRSCYHDSFIHGPAINYLCTGTGQVGHPSVGAWVTYGLGCESQELPAYVVMTDGVFRGGSGMYQAGYLPALYQGTVIRTEGSPIQNLSTPPTVDRQGQRRLLDQLAQWNGRHAEDRPADSRLEARIANYELAFRMQAAAPEVMSLGQETQGTLDRYGVQEARTARFGRMCLLARRMVARGVRFVQLVNNDWDGHGECAKNHSDNAAATDQPMAALLADLKERGLFESTLVIWCGEFGRTPVMQGNQGRDHSPYGFSVWLAGGGIRGGQAIGSTDELGFRAVEDKVHVNDLHATLLSLLGLDHERLTFLFEGRNRRLTDVGGNRQFTRRLVG
jgi:uncharacterized protein (DUF1501 family)